MPLDRENPWLGLASYTEEEQQFFYGREVETAELLRLIERDTLTVLYGVSGLGKSSLLRAGLFPRLRTGDYLPVYLRLDHDPAAPPLPAQILAALTAEARIHSVDAPAPRSSDTLWEHFHREQHQYWNSRQRMLTPVLVLDQFEEIFTLGSDNADRRARGQQLISELSALLANCPPEHVQRDFEARGEMSAGFLFETIPIRVVFGLREDFLAHLSALRPQFPNLRQNELRLLPLSLAQAQEIILGPGRQLIEPGVEDAIVQYVAGGGETREATVEPALLSVVLHELNVVRQQQGLPIITADLLTGSQKRILVDFYERAFEGLDPRTQLFVEDELLTPGGFRDSRAMDDAVTRPGVTAAALNLLVERRLLHYEYRESGAARIELSHDLLCSVVKDQRTRRRDAEAQIQLLKWKRRSRKMIAAAAVAVIVLAALAAAFAYESLRPGPISINHASLTNGCSACHQPDGPAPPNSTFARTLRTRVFGVSRADTTPACVSCHISAQLHCPQEASLQLASVSAGVLAVDSGVCSNCHREHMGIQSLARPASDGCVSCHGNAEQMKAIIDSGEGSRRFAFSNPNQVLVPETIRISAGFVRFAAPATAIDQRKAFKSYAEGHPPFKYEAIGARDSAHVRFNHQRHLMPDVIGREGDRVNTNAGEKMDCTLCHKPGDDGRYIQPVSFEQHCRRCHSLDIDLTDIVPPILIKVPHGDSEKVKAFLSVGNLTSVFDNAAKAAGLTSEVDLVRVRNDFFASLHRRGMLTLGDLHKRVFWTGDPPQDESGVQQIMSQRTLASCAKCHEVNPPRASMYTEQITPIIAPTNIPERWVNHGPFTHTPHQHMKCEDCHADDKYTIKNARRSTLPADILMPRQTICAECHRPTSEADLTKRKTVKPSTMSPSSSPLEKDAERAARQRIEGGIKWDCQDCHQFHAPGEALLSKGILVPHQLSPVVLYAPDQFRNVLAGDFIVTSAQSTTVVLRPRATASRVGQTLSRMVRAVVDFPSGTETPREGATLHVGPGDGFAVRAIRRGKDGQWNLEVQKLPAP